MFGGRIAKALAEPGSCVRAPVRAGAAPDQLDRLPGSGITTVAVDLNNGSQLASACQGASCVVSALQGLRDVIVEKQTVLLDTAVKAGVARFIPSDSSIGFTRFPPGENRNLDLRRDFHKRLETASIAATTISNGAFADRLTGQRPLTHGGSVSCIGATPAGAWTSRQSTTPPHSPRVRRSTPPLPAICESRAIRSAPASRRRLPAK